MRLWVVMSWESPKRVNSGVFSRMGWERSVVSEIEQKLWIRLFVATPPRPPKIAEYSGRGRLGGWLRMVAARVAIDEFRSIREQSFDRVLEETLLWQGPDPEIEYCKRQYAAEFQTSFATALASLEPRQRNLLNQYFLHGLSIDQLAKLFRVHRATAARQRAATRSIRANASSSKLRALTSENRR